MKLPRGMFQRGRSYYIRLFEGGRDKWVSLGPDLEEAKSRLQRLRAGVPTNPKITVAEAAKRWLESYVRTARNEKGQRLACCRAKNYLVPQLGGKAMAEVTPDELRGYRLTLERMELAPQTVSHVLTDARCLFSWAEFFGAGGALACAAPIASKASGAIAGPSHAHRGRGPGRDRRAVRLRDSARTRDGASLGRVVPLARKRRPKRRTDGEPDEEREATKGSPASGPTRRGARTGRPAGPIPGGGPRHVQLARSKAERGRALSPAHDAAHLRLPMDRTRR